MTQIAQYFAQARPSGRSARSPATYPQRSTRHLDAMASFGAGLAGISFDEIDRRREILEQTEYTEGKVAWLNAQYDFDESLNADSDFGTYLERFNKTADQAQSSILERATLPGSKRALETMMTEHRPSLQASVADKAWSKRMGFARASALMEIDKLVQKGDPVAEQAVKEIYARGAGNIFDPEEAGRGIIATGAKFQSIREDRDKQAQEAARRSELDSLADEAIGKAIQDNDITGANELIRSQKGLSSPERNELEGRLQGALADKKRQDDQYDSEGLREFNKRLRDGVDLSTFDGAVDGYKFNDPKIVNDLTKAAEAKRKAILEDDDVIDDIPTKRGFEDRARAIDSEDEKVESFIAELRASTTLSESSKNRIEDMARTTFTTSQKNAITRAVQEARNLELPVMPAEKQIELEWLRTGERGTKETQAKIIASVIEEIDLQHSLSAAAEEEINAWVSKEDNRDKPRSTIDKETNYILTRYRSIRNAGIETMRIHQRLMNDKTILSPETTKSVRKGPVNSPTFQVNAQGALDKDSYEYDTDGKEIGVKHGGGVLKIGDRYIKDGWELEYLGGGKTKKIGSASVRKR